MTAARPSDGLTLRIDPYGWPARLLAGLLCVTTAWVPWALAWGDAMSEAGLAAQEEGTALAEEVTLPEVSGDTLTLFPGQPNETRLDLEELFPGSDEGDLAEYTDLFGNDPAVVNAGQAAQESLLTEESATGAAYQGLRESVERPRPDLSHDPLWSQTDNVLDNFEELAASFADCSIQTEFSEGERYAHVPEYRTCERVMDYSGAREIRHDYRIEEIFELGSGGTFEPCGEGCVLWTVGRSLQPGPCYQELTGIMRVLKPEAIESAVLEELWYEDYIAGLWIDGTNHYSHTAGECDNDDSPTVWLGHDVSAYFQTEGEKRVLLALIQGGDLGGGTVRIRIRFDPSQALVADTWEDDPPCLDLVSAIDDGACGGAIQCAQMPELTDGCIPFTGGSICAEDLLPAPVAGISSLCQLIAVSAECSGFYQGQMDCWTDPQGELHCPYNEGGVQTNCTALEEDPQCEFISSECVKYAQGESGLCYVFEETWDCGTLQGIPVLQGSTSMDCAGPVRCLGEDCLDAAEEQSSDFASAAAALGAAQTAVSDTDCSTGSCVVFSGEAMECKKAVGGIVDCCTTPEGISLVDYLSLVLAIGKIDNALMGLDSGNALRGSWETLRSPVVSAWSEVTKSFTSVANNLTGSTVVQASDAAAQLSLDAFKQALMQQTAEWVAQVFGEAAANALFTVNGGAAFVGGNLQAGTIEFGGAVGTALSWVMTAYMIYTVTVILIQLIWTCEEEEFELGVKRELKSCHYVGSYCKTKVPGACIERRKAYCCFNSPLARILGEQIRPQLGRGWGESDDPDCTGIAVEDFERIDWEQVNLDEWLAILTETGYYLTPEDLDLEELTGTGSEYDLADEREDAAGRSKTRSDGLDSDAARWEAETELWESTLPGLP
jgi:conjugal transfer mating pair stabilization protein TraN